MLSYNVPMRLMKGIGIYLDQSVGDRLMSTRDDPVQTGGGRRAFRAVSGLLAIVGGLMGLAGLYFVPIPEGNREPLLLAMGMVLGWGSTVIGYEFGAVPAGGRAANAGPDPIE
jgi:hypothetical protein